MKVFKNSLAVLLILCVFFGVGCTSQKSAYVQRVDTYSTVMGKTADTMTASLKSHAELQKQVASSLKLTDTILSGEFDPSAEPPTTPIDPEAKKVIVSATKFVKAYATHLAKLNDTKDVTDKSLKEFAVSLSELDENDDFKELIRDRDFAIKDSDIENVVTGIRTLSHLYIDHKIYEDLPALASDAKPTVDRTIDFLIKINDGINQKTKAQYKSLIGDKFDTIGRYVNNSNPGKKDVNKAISDGFVMPYDLLQKLITEHDTLVAESKASKKQFENTKKAMEKLKKNYVWLTDHDMPRCTAEQLDTIKAAKDGDITPNCYDPREILYIWAKVEEALDFRKTVLEKK